MTTELVLRFITALDADGEPLGPEVCRIEGMGRCRQCSRLHPYQLARLDPDEGGNPSLGARGLFDSYEDARFEVWRWLPEAARYHGGRDPDDDPWTDDRGETVERIFDTRESVINWLLEPVPDGA